MANAPKPKRCPLCGKPPQDAHAPFCSRGCKDRDLLKWLGGGYRIAGSAVDEQLPLGRVDSEESES